MCFFRIGTGVSILISQYTGAKESEKVVSVCGTSITFIYIIGIPIGILGCLRHRIFWNL